jgi:hypothetical protein
MAKPTYEWFIEPLNAFTNESLSMEIPSENATRELVDNKGKRHNVWLCSSEFPWRFWNSRGPDTKFNVFRRKVTSQSKGKIEKVNFIFRRPYLQRKNPKIQKVQKQLKEISQS